MSYSRWGWSKWYTYWDAGKSGETKNTQFFQANAFSFSYERLKTDMLSCLEECGGDDELKGYMRDFLADVEAEYE